MVSDSSLLKQSLRNVAVYTLACVLFVGTASGVLLFVVGRALNPSAETSTDGTPATTSEDGAKKSPAGSPQRVDSKKTKHKGEAI